MKRSIIISLTILFLFLSCSSNNKDINKELYINNVSMSSVSHYDLVYREANINVDGNVDEIWDSVPSIEGNFHFPWENVEAPKTIFKSFVNAANIYFLFISYDEEIVYDENWNNENTVDNEDRVEIFFAPSNIDKPYKNGLPEYYAIEVDPLGRVHDYSTVYYRNINSEWNMKGLETKASINDKYYIVEGVIPISTLNELDLVHSDYMRIGLYRAEFSNNADGSLNMRWISWVNPKVSQPDYHVDSSFGEFRFIK